MSDALSMNRIDNLRDKLWEDIRSLCVCYVIYPDRRAEIPGIMREKAQELSQIKGKGETTRFVDYPEIEKHIDKSIEKLEQRSISGIFQMIDWFVCIICPFSDLILEKKGVVSKLLALIGYPESCKVFFYHDQDIGRERREQIKGLCKEKSWRKPGRNRYDDFTFEDKYVLLDDEKGFVDLVWLGVNSWIYVSEAKRKLSILRKGPELSLLDEIKAN